MSKKRRLELAIKMKTDLQNAKIALEQSRLMDCIIILRDTESYDDETVDYFKTLLIKDIDDGESHCPNAINYLNNDIAFISQEIDELLGE